MTESIQELNTIHPGNILGITLIKNIRENFCRLLNILNIYFLITVKSLFNWFFLFNTTKNKPLSINLKNRTRILQVNVLR